MATEVVSTVIPSGGGDYLSLAAWEAGEQTDLVTADEIAVAEIESGETNVANYLDFNGWTQNATHYCLIRAVSGDEFNPNTLTGAKITQSGSPDYVFVVRALHWLYIENIGFSDCVSGNFIYGGAGEKAVFNRCVFYDTNIVDYSTAKGEINFSLIIPSYLDSNKYGGSPYKFTLNNTTIIQELDLGSYGGDIAAYNCICNNVVIINKNTKSSYDSYYTCTGDYNAQNDNNSADPPGTHSFSTLVAADDFEDYDGGDYHSSGTSSALYRVGLNLVYSSDLDSPQTDIDGDSLPEGVSDDWDIGFDYHVASGGTTILDDTFYKKLLSGAEL